TASSCSRERETAAFGVLLGSPGQAGSSPRACAASSRPPPASSRATSFASRLRSRPMRLPGPIPFLLEPSPVRLEKPPIFAARLQLIEGRLPEVVDESILGADDPIPGPARSLRVVVVLEHPELEPLVKRADLL